MSRAGQLWGKFWSHKKNSGRRREVDLLPLIQLTENRHVPDDPVVLGNSPQEHAVVGGSLESDHDQLIQAVHGKKVDRAGRIAGNGLVNCSQTAFEGGGVCVQELNDFFLGRGGGRTCQGDDGVGGDRRPPAGRALTGGRRDRCVSGGVGQEKVDNILLASRQPFLRMRTKSAGNARSVPGLLMPVPRSLRFVFLSGSPAINTELYRPNGVSNSGFNGSACQRPHSDLPNPFFGFC